ncbi:MAG: transposase, IS4 family protein [uncultured bacterium]|nr:MAG: transposase, IS4 family protein [uncultured bacterium]
MILVPIVEIFCDIDEFYKDHIKKSATKLLPLPKGKRRRKTELSESEMLTIMILFHLSHYRTFKDFYIDCVLGQLSREFPKALSYLCFVALMPRLLASLTAYVLSRMGKHTGLYYLDSTKIVVCHNRYIYRNKVFKGIAERGHCSVGFFYGFKLHLIITSLFFLLRILIHN